MDREPYTGWPIYNHQESFGLGWVVLYCYRIPGMQILQKEICSLVRHGVKTVELGPSKLLSSCFDLQVIKAAQFIVLLQEYCSCSLQYIYIIITGSVFNAACNSFIGIHVTSR